MSVIAVIPARYESSRFPGKPLADVGGKPMIRRVYEQAVLCKGLDHVIVATDDNRIVKAVAAFGGKAVMTPSECASGTDRVFQAAKSLSHIKAEYIINIQGDQVVFAQDAVENMVKALKGGCEMTTIAVRADEKDMDDPNAAKVVCNEAGYALYFSRSPIPYFREPGHYAPLKHIGIYGFHKDTLARISSLKPTALEKSESLEQLRALENGIPIYVVVTKGKFSEINTPEDRDFLLKTRSWRD
jgi:3-deoxy-manno-octulosonate cytidylyltransferase (CMP-KDO synthetase)